MKGDYLIARQFSDEDQEPDPKPNKADALRYINAIKNPDKKLYAQLYYKFLLGDTYKPDSSGLSYMAAQGVRLRLSKTLGV